MINPFESIIPREEELMINEEFLKTLSEKIKSQINTKRLIIIEGDYGTGKSLYLKRLFERLKTKKEMIYFNDVIIQVLEGKVPVKDKSIFIDDFDLMQGLNEEQLFRLTEIMIKILENGMVLIISARKETIKKLFEANQLIISKSQKIKIPPLSFEESKSLINKRLNESRKNKNDSLEPFSERELRLIWKKSNGNPRLLLLLLSPLFDQKNLLNEDY